ncbi:MAG: hypothetical protein DMG09_10650 [Acidobacteria bacterium]|nr:MAG: hypothetical protein DMG09_10650 [Acidobacteriota bacterium]
MRMPAPKYLAITISRASPRTLLIIVARLINPADRATLRGRPLGCVWAPPSKLAGTSLSVTLEIPLIAPRDGATAKSLQESWALSDALKTPNDQ